MVVEEGGVAIADDLSTETLAAKDWGDGFKDGRERLTEERVEAA